MINYWLNRHHAKLWLLEVLWIGVILSCGGNTNQQFVEQETINGGTGLFALHAKLTMMVKLARHIFIALCQF